MVFALTAQASVRSRPTARHAGAVLQQDVRHFQAQKQYPLRQSGQQIVHQDLAKQFQLQMTEPSDQVQPNFCRRS